MHRDYYETHSNFNGDSVLRMKPNKILIFAILLSCLAFSAYSQDYAVKPAWWDSILFVTRIGASIIEVMCDTYFFKKVDSLNANIISFFRMSNPIAYIVAPLFAVIMLNFFSLELQYLFLALGLIMFIGLKFSLSLEDTK